MYNSERKERWLQTIEDADLEKQSRSFLDRIGIAVEEKLDDDLFELIVSGKRDDVISCLEDNGKFVSYRILRRFCAYANSYLTWCYATMLSSVPPQNAKLKAYDISLVQSFRKSFIRTQDELESALIDAPLREGFILPVCCSLAWMGYSVKEMCELKTKDVSVDGQNVIVRGVMAPEGFVRDTLRLWAKTDVFYRGVRDVAYVKSSGNEFVRQTFPEDGVYTQLKNIVDGVRSIAARYVVRRTGDSVSYRQLAAAGELNALRGMEASGKEIDQDVIASVCKVKGQMAIDRLREYRQFCLSFEV